MRCGSVVGGVRVCWEKVREGGEEGEVTCCSRESSSQKQSAQRQGRGDHDRVLNIIIVVNKKKLN